MLVGYDCGENEMGVVESVNHLSSAQWTSIPESANTYSPMGMHINYMPINKTNALKEPLTSAGLDLLVVELPFILSIHIVERSHLQPTRLQREPGSQFLQLRLLLVLEEITMLSHLRHTQQKNPTKM